MRTLKYPKTYATLREVKNTEEEWPFDRCRPVYIFETDSGEIIRAVDPRTSGSFKGKYETVLWKKPGSKIVKEIRVRKVIGARVKLYQRPQDNGRWSYRHIGE